MARAVRNTDILDHLERACQYIADRRDDMVAEAQCRHSGLYTCVLGGIISVINSLV